MKEVSKEVKRLTEEVIGKASNMNYCNMDLSNGGHVSVLHVGMTDEQLLSRQKEDIKSGRKTRCMSSFIDMNTVNVCLWEMFTDEYMLQHDVAAWLADLSQEDRKPFNYFVSEDAGVVGRVVLPNGGIKQTDCFRIVLQRLPLGERDTITGMPFVVISMYPIIWD